MRSSATAKAVYHTGGYLGNGETVWLLAKIDKKLESPRGDIVEPYALMANSHDGSTAFHIRLTTVRVVCQNTIAFGAQRRSSANSSAGLIRGPCEHARSSQEFFRPR